MWFAIVAVFRGAIDSPSVWTVNFWFAENEGDAPDNDFVFRTFNGMGGPIDGSIRIPRSLSVGDWFSVVPIEDPKDLDEFNYIGDFHYENAHNVPVVTVEDFGFSEKSHADYWAM